MNVMIVEDNATMRTYIKQFIAKYVRNVEMIIETADGNEAIEQYRTGHPDWVVMDIQMEQMDGITAAQAIRRMDDHAKIIILTAHDEEVFRNAARNAGVIAYVLKENLRELTPILEAG